MKKIFLLAALAALGAGAAPAQQKAPKGPVELAPASRIQSTTDQKGRGDGPFGEYWWANRFLSRIEQVRAAKGKTVDLVLVGDSIMHFWEWKHPASWKRFTEGRSVINCGYGGDRTQHVIWRIQHGELDGYAARAVVVMIGTNNNSSEDTAPANVAKGVERIVALVRARQPKAKIILHPIFPRGVSADSARHNKARVRNDRTNELLKAFAQANPDIAWIDFNDKLVGADGWVPREIMADEIHPTDKGYDLWMEALAPVLSQVLGK